MKWKYVVQATNLREVTKVDQRHREEIQVEISCGVF